MSMLLSYETLQNFVYENNTIMGVATKSTGV